MQHDPLWQGLGLREGPVPKLSLLFCSVDRLVVYPETFHPLTRLSILEAKLPQHRQSQEFMTITAGMVPTVYERLSPFPEYFMLMN